MKAERVTDVAKEVERFSRLGATRLQHGNTDKALEAYRQAYLKSQLLGYNGYMQRACAFNLGSIFISTGNFAEGLIYLKQAKPPEGQHDGKSNGDLYFNSGLAYEGLQNTEEMKRCYTNALAEYQSEDNVSMQADVLARLGKAYVMCGQFSEATACSKQLIQAHAKLGDYAKQLQFQAEQASLLLQTDAVRDAESVADDCFMKCLDKELSSSIANILIELSLTYTHMRSYDKALQCCQSALPVTAAKDADLKQIAVLYQNLGVIHSFLGQYQKAIEYHQRAASKYAELNNRKSQGHCFINLGYAYSQLKDIDQAGEYFLHSLQAAKDCGDRKSEWQCLEALGSVAYHHGNIKHSQEYYRAALSVLAKSPDADDTVVQDRILEKLTNVVQLQPQKSFDEPHGSTTQGSGLNSRLFLGFMNQHPSSQDRAMEVSSPSANLENIQSRASLAADNNTLVKARSKEGSVIALKKGAKIKYLRVRRSGTLLKFNKIAHGLDPNMSSLATDRQSSMGLGLEEDVFSASTIDISDIDESNEALENDKKGHYAYQSSQMERRAASYLEKDEDVDEGTESEEDKERKRVHDAMREVVDYEDEKAISLQTGFTGGTLHPREALMNRSGTLSEEDSQSDEEKHSEQPTNSDDETASDDDEQTDVNDSIENTDDEEEEEDGTDKNDVPPKIPTMLPLSTNTGPSRTYEVPVNTAGCKPSAGHSPDLAKMSANTGQVIFSPMKVSRDYNGVNFFNSEEPGAEDKIYESIRLPTLLPTLQDNNAKNDDGDSESDNETESELTAHERLPKGERDKIEYKAFHADLRARRAVEAKADDTVTPKKSSRVCVMM